MALLANYANGMRVGQGFNSYTQSICIDDAVVINSPQPANDDRKLTNGTSVPTDAASLKDSSVPEAVPSPPGTNVDQIVTFSSRSIDNMSDIMDALNISSSASIKYGTVKGSGSASFVNENKVNDSDLNFIITVKVTNSSPAQSGTMKFNPIPDLDPENFTETYGDCFISGFLEGGEFSAIISIKVQQKSNVSKVKLAAEMELAVGVPGLTAGLKDDFEKNKSDVWKDTETTISVNWSGGGDIKKADANWDLKTVVQAANDFPSKVATCSQRTSAILMKYTSLRSFQQANVNLKKPYKVLDYSCCDLYTMDLFSAYMAYKRIWKNISNMMKDSRSYRALPKSKDVTDPVQTDPQSLNMARRDARKAMTQILEETKLLATNPELAGVDANGELRKPMYMFPAVLQSRLPRYQGGSQEDVDGNYRDFTGEELAVIGQHAFNEDLSFSYLVGESNPKKTKEHHVFSSLHSDPTDKLDYLTDVRIHAHQHHLLDHFRDHLGDFTSFSKESQRAVCAIGFNTSRDEARTKDPRSKPKCKCGLNNHVGRHDHEKEDIDDKFLSRPATLVTSSFASDPVSGGITKVVIGYIPGTFRIAALTLYSADGMKVCAWNMYDDLETKPKLQLKTLTPPDEGTREGKEKQVKWVLAGFWGRADLVVDQLGAVWQRVGVK